jgi:hypothetical protein
VKWISTLKNKIADDISRLKVTNLPHSAPHYDFLQLKIKTGPQGTQSMLFLPPESQATLCNLENIVNAKMSLVKQGSGDETARFRHAVYIDWTKRKVVPDPCGNQPGYSCIISCFVENLMLDNNCHFKTVKGYVESINTLFKLRGFAILIDFSDKQNMCTRLIDEIE